MQEARPAREAAMNGYGQRWAPWGWATTLSIIFWVAAIWLVVTLAGCAAFGFEHTIKATKSAAPNGDAPVPPSAVIPECRDAMSLSCCCDMSTKGILTCRCPHPGGTVGTTP